MSASAAMMPAPVLDALTVAEITATATPRPVLFLDRDGVVNVDRGYVHTDRDTEWMPGVFELADRARAAGMAIVVVTNQAGIARGYYDEATFRDYSGWMHAQFRARGVPLLATYFCPHHPQPGGDRVGVVCGCRKPAPGMFRAAIEAFAIDPAHSTMIGDKPSDLEAARAAGISEGFLLEGPDLNEALAWFSCRREILK